MFLQSVGMMEAGLVCADSGAECDDAHVAAPI
jgi:hypothetical protein